MSCYKILRCSGRRLFALALPNQSFHAIGSVRALSLTHERLQHDGKPKADGNVGPQKHDDSKPKDHNGDGSGGAAEHAKQQICPSAEEQVKILNKPFNSNSTSIRDEQVKWIKDRINRKPDEVKNDGVFIVVRGPGGIGKSTAIDCALQDRKGVVKIPRVSPGTKEDEITDSVFSMITGIKEPCKQHTKKLKDVIDLFCKGSDGGIAPVVVIPASARKQKEDPARLTDAGRTLAEDFGLNVIIDCSENAFSNQLRTGRENFLDMEPMTPRMLQNLPNYDHLFDTLNEAGDLEIILAICDGRPRDLNNFALAVENCSKLSDDLMSKLSDKETEVLNAYKSSTITQKEAMKVAFEAKLNLEQIKVWIDAADPKLTSEERARKRFEAEKTWTPNQKAAVSFAEKKLSEDKINAIRAEANKQLAFNRMNIYSLYTSENSIIKKILQRFKEQQQVPINEVENISNLNTTNVLRIITCTNSNSADNLFVPANGAVAVLLYTGCYPEKYSFDKIKNAYLKWLKSKVDDDKGQSTV